MEVNRREAKKEFRERKTPKGIFAIRCAASGQVWVGRSRHLNTAQNGIWFALRTGAHLHKGLQAAWNAHGEAAFAYEIAEEFDEDLSPLLLNDMFREREKHWAKEWGASTVNAA
jgi:hypothetical protein